MRPWRGGGLLPTYRDAARRGAAAVLFSNAMREKVRKDKPALAVKDVAK